MTVTPLPVPLKPHGAGKIAHVFGGPATSPTDVLQRARAALAPRGAWVRGGYTGKTQEGHARCAVQVIGDVDGVHATSARHYLLKAIRELDPSCPSIQIWNDMQGRKKHEVLERFDRAIELSKKYG